MDLPDWRHELNRRHLIKALRADESRLTQPVRTPIQSDEWERVMSMRSDCLVLRASSVDAALMSAGREVTTGHSRAVERALASAVAEAREHRRTLLALELSLLWERSFPEPSARRYLYTARLALHHGDAGLAGGHILWVLEELERSVDLAVEEVALRLALRALLGLGDWSEAEELARAMSPDGHRCEQPGSRIEVDLGDVPSTVHQYWEPDLPPSLYLDRMSKWRELNPGFTFVLWNAKSAETLLEQVSERAAAAFRSLRVPAARADLFRYAVLWSNGGTYVDVDDVVGAPLNRTVTMEAGLHVVLKGARTYTNNFIACPAMHPVMDAALKRATDNIENRKGRNAKQMTGPGVLSRVMNELIRGRLASPGVIHIWSGEQANLLRQRHPGLPRESTGHWSTIPITEYFVQ